jgi:hypothetical protein
VAFHGRTSTRTISPFHPASACYDSISKASKRDCYSATIRIASSCIEARMPVPFGMLLDDPREIEIR